MLTSVGVRSVLLTFGNKGSAWTSEAGSSISIYTDTSLTTLGPTLASISNTCNVSILFGKDALNDLPVSTTSILLSSSFTLASCSLIPAFTNDNNSEKVLNSGSLINCFLLISEPLVFLFTKSITKDASGAT